MAVSKISKQILAVQQELGRVARGGEYDAAGVNYSFLAANDLIAVVKPLLNKHGVTMNTTLVDHEVTFFTGEAAGARVPKRQVHIIGTYDFTFTSVEDGSTEVTRVLAEATDTSDKSARKLATSATKIALIQRFVVETSEPDEHELDRIGDEPEEKKAPATAAERGVSKAKITAPKASPKPVSAGKAEGDEAKAKIKANYLESGKMTAVEVNELFKAKAVELGDSRVTAKVYPLVLADLEAGK